MCLLLEMVGALPSLLFSSASRSVNCEQNSGLFGIAHGTTGYSNVGIVGTELGTERTDKDIFNKKKAGVVGRFKMVGAFHTL
jgi:hypothetical protein